MGCKPNLGGCWNNGAGAGLFCLNYANPASNANTNVGCRLATRRHRKPRSHGGADSVRFGVCVPLPAPDREKQDRAGAVSSPTGDHGPGPRILFLGRKPDLGGAWNNGAGAGLFCLNFINAASNVNTSIGCRLAIRRHRKPRSHGGADSVRFGVCVPLPAPDREKQDRAGAVSSPTGDHGPGPHISFLGRKPDLGGNWTYGAGAGLFCLNWNQPASYGDTNIGCRLAIRRHRKPCPYGGADSVRFGVCAPLPAADREKQDRAGAVSSPRATMAPARRLRHAEDC